MGYRKGGRAMTIAAKPRPTQNLPQPTTEPVRSTPAPIRVRTCCPSCARLDGFQHVGCILRDVFGKLLEQRECFEEVSTMPRQEEKARVN